MKMDVEPPHSTDLHPQKNNISDKGSTKWCPMPTYFLPSQISYENII